MQRRKFIAGMGSLAAAGAAGVGTGAFTTVSAERTISVGVADDSEALLSMTQTGTGLNSQYATLSNGQVTINLDNSDDGAGSGLNKDAETNILDIFRIKNQGTQPVFVYVDPASVTPDKVTPDAGGGYAEGQKGIYIDPQASNRPNQGLNYRGQAVSMTGIYGVHDPTAGFDDRDTNSSSDLKSEDLTLSVGDALSFGLFVRTAQNTPDSFEMSMNIVADADLAADLS